MHAVFSKFGSVRRKDTPVVPNETLAPTPMPPPPAPPQPEAPLELSRDSNDPLRQSTIVRAPLFEPCQLARQDPRYQLQASKALEPSAMEWVMKGTQIEKIGHGQYASPCIYSR